MRSIRKMERLKKKVEKEVKKRTRSRGFHLRNAQLREWETTTYGVGES
jgi:hypothetical protein